MKGLTNTMNNVSKHKVVFFSSTYEKIKKSPELIQSNSKQGCLFTTSTIGHRILVSDQRSSLSESKKGIRKEREREITRIQKGEDNTRLKKSLLLPHTLPSNILNLGHSTVDLTPK